MNVKFDSVHRELFKYWQLRSGRNKMPARADFRPEDVPGILKHLGLIDVVHRAKRMNFRYRLVGTRMNVIFGRDFTNTWLNESKHGNYHDFLYALYCDAAGGSNLVYSETKFEYQGNRHLRVKRLMLPMSSDDQKVDMILFSNLFSSDDHDFGFRPYLPEEILDFAEVHRIAA
jgi:hypothetical protein